MWTCNNCDEELDDAFDACWKCGTVKGEARPDAVGAGNPEVQSKGQSSEGSQGALTTLNAPVGAASDSAEQQFLTLSGYAKVFSGIGWFVVAVGVIVTLFGLSQEDSVLLALMGGGAVIVSGVVIVASGQLISCIVAIQRDTSKIAQMLHDRSLG